MANWLFDFGHGGSDSGAVNGTRYEKNDVLKMGLDVRNILIQNGENVNCTRTTDKTLSLSERSSMENKGSYNYFVSFHRNSATNKTALGVETYIFEKGGVREELAKKVQNALVKIGFIDRGVKTANFHVLRQTKCSAILIEIGFISNDVDNSLFDSKYSEIVQAIANALLEQVGKKVIASDVVVKQENVYVLRLKQECEKQGLKYKPTVKYGAKGNITKIIQEILKVSVDGIFGTETLEAVKNFQKKNGLVVDGVVGEKTWNKLLDK